MQKWCSHSLHCWYRVSRLEETSNFLKQDRGKDSLRSGTIKEREEYISAVPLQAFLPDLFLGIDEWGCGARWPSASTENRNRFPKFVCGSELTQASCKRSHLRALCIVFTIGYCQNSYFSSPVAENGRLKAGSCVCPRFLVSSSVYQPHAWFPGACDGGSHSDSLNI